MADTQPSETWQAVMAANEEGTIQYDTRYWVVRLTSAENPRREPGHPAFNDAPVWAFSGEEPARKFRDEAAGKVSSLWDKWETGGEAGFPASYGWSGCTFRWELWVCDEEDDLNAMKFIDEETGAFWRTR